jgi:hypothetical protein
MEIIVEFGTDEQNELIRSELYHINELLTQIPYLNIKKLIVPSDFDKKVNELQKTSSYTAFRGHLDGAKIVDIDEGVAIVISPLLFNERFDWQVRIIFYMHEIMHAVNKPFLLKPKTDSKSMFRTITKLNILYDEYFANRRALEIIRQTIPEKTYILKRYICNTFNGHIQSLINNEIYYNTIKREIGKFRFHRNILYLFEKIYRFYDEASKDIVYRYAYMDTFERLKRIEPILSRSKLIN